MTTEELNEILETVDNLNEYLTENLVYMGFTFSYETNGWWHGIKFMDYVLWSSENETREWVDAENKYEPLYPIILTEFQKIATMFGNLERINKLKRLKK